MSNTLTGQRNYYHQEAEREHELLVCASHGDLDRMRQLVEIHRVNVNCPTQDGRTYACPLILAVEEGNIEVARFLLENDANVDALDCLGRTVLGHAVILNGRVALAELLLEFGANVDKHFGPYSLLGYAINKIEVEMVALLLRFGANTEEIMYGGKSYSALYLACWRSNVEVVQLLLDHNDGADVNAFQPREGDTSAAMSPLCKACEHNNLELVQLLVQHGARVTYDGVYPDVPSPLVEAVKHDESLELVRFLLDQTNLQGQRGDDNHPFSPALEIALKFNKLQAAQLLVDHGANMDDGAFIFLHRFAKDGQYKYDSRVCFLLRAGANVNLADRESGETPLWVAAKNGHVELVQELLKARADVRIRDNGGETPLGVAYRQGHTDIVYLLLRTSPHVWPNLAEVWDMPLPETAHCNIL